MRSLIAVPWWNALRRFYKKLRPWILQNAVGKSWNDEPSVRHLNLALTPYVERIAACQLVQSSLVLSIFVKPGTPVRSCLLFDCAVNSHLSCSKGFIYHTDSSPPFDLTLDFVIDHEGPSSRPVYFIRKNPNGLLPIVERHDCGVGEALVFRGAEMTHWGGDLKEDSHHTIILLTWQQNID